MRLLVLYVAVVGAILVWCASSLTIKAAAEGRQVTTAIATPRR